jgi:hypothetical protein
MKRRKKPNRANGGNPFGGLTSSEVNAILSAKPETFVRCDGGDSSTPPDEWKWKLRPAGQVSTEIGNA